MSLCQCLFFSSRVPCRIFKSTVIISTTTCIDSSPCTSKFWPKHRSKGANVSHRRSSNSRINGNHSFTTYKPMKYRTGCHFSLLTPSPSAGTTGSAGRTAAHRTERTSHHRTDVPEHSTAARRVESRRSHPVVGRLRPCSTTLAAHHQHSSERGEIPSVVTISKLTDGLHGHQTCPATILYLQPTETCNSSRTSLNRIPSLCHVYS